MGLTAGELRAKNGQSARTAVVPAWVRATRRSVGSRPGKRRPRVVDDEPDARAALRPVDRDLTTVVPAGEASTAWAMSSRTGTLDRLRCAGYERSSNRDVHRDALLVDEAAKRLHRRVNESAPRSISVSSSSGQTHRRFRASRSPCAWETRRRSVSGCSSVTSWRRIRPSSRPAGPGTARSSDAMDKLRHREKLAAGTDRHRRTLENDVTSSPRSNIAASSRA